MATSVGIYCAVELHREFVDAPKVIPAAAGETAKDGNNEGGVAVERWTSGELTLTGLSEITLGVNSRIAVQVTIAFSQLGIMMAYCIYLGTVGTQWAPSVPEWLWVLFLFPVFVAVCQLRDIKMLRDWAAVGVIAGIICMVAVFCVCMASIGDKGIADVKGGFEIAKFPTFFGVMFFAMEV